MRVPYASIFFSFILLSTPAHTRSHLIKTAIHWSNQQNDNNFKKSKIHRHYSQNNTWKNSYSTKNFHDYFIDHGYTEKEIMQHYCLYMLDEFVRLAQAYPSYECTIQQLHDELKNLTIIQKAYRIIKGTYCAGLQKRIHFLIGVTAFINTDQAKDKWNKYTEQLNTIIDAINNKEITVRDALKDGTTLAVGLTIQGKLLGGLSKFCNTIKQKATRFAQNNISSFTIQKYLATPEGYLLRSVAKTSCDASCPNQYDHLKQWLQIKEFTSVINTTKHGIERLIERGFTPQDVYETMHHYSFTKFKKDGSLAYIKQIGNNFNVIIFNKQTQKLITAIKNTDQKSLNNLGKKYGWQ